MARLCERAGIRRELHRFHLPVGGRRFRPSVEDVIEFLAVEGLVEARPGWQDVVEVERAEFHRVQLLAAIRRDPETARQALDQLGWSVLPPDDA